MMTSAPRSSSSSRAKGARADKAKARCEPGVGSEWPALPAQHEQAQKETMRWD